MRPFLGGHRVAADKSAGGRAEEAWSGSGIWNKINVSDVNTVFLGSNFYSKSTHEYKCNSDHCGSVKSVKSTLHFCVVFPKTIACHIRPNDHSAQVECNRYNIINYNILPTKGSEQNTHTRTSAHKTQARRTHAPLRYNQHYNRKICRQFPGGAIMTCGSRQQFGRAPLP